MGKFLFSVGVTAGLIAFFVRAIAPVAVPAIILYGILHLVN